MLGATQSGSAQAQSNFYRGKTLTMLIGYTSGGGYDLYARVLSKHMGRHLPGSPSIVPQNMPGAGSLRVANVLYNSFIRDLETCLKLVPRRTLLDMGLRSDSFWAMSLAGRCSTSVAVTVASSRSWLETVRPPA